jgi:hypothetical protein
MDETSHMINVTQLMMSARIEHIIVLECCVENYKCVLCKWNVCVYLCLRALVCTAPHSEVSISCSLSSAGVKTSESRGGREEGRCRVLHIQYEGRASKVTDVLCTGRAT